MGVAQDKYIIQHTSGYTNLLDSENAETNFELMRANTDAGGKNIVVFDADFPSNNGGFSSRREELLKKRDESGLKYDLFLWPNNNSDGDVEVLMESIARKDLYPEYFECFGKFEHCMSQRKKKMANPFIRHRIEKGNYILISMHYLFPRLRRKNLEEGNGDGKTLIYGTWTLIH